MENQIEKAQTSEVESLEMRLQKFTKLLNKEPEQSELEPTPDGNAKTLPISFVEMTLDELFFGQWSTENFKWSAIANEVQGSLELVLTHPVTQKEIRRVGAASIIIMVDKVPEEVKKNPQEKNRWSLNPDNKKPNALDMAFPKLKAECIANAARSLGKRFGRDINRKKADQYKPLLPMDVKPFDIKLLASEKDIRVALAKGNITMDQATQLALELNLQPA